MYDDHIYVVLIDGQRIEWRSGVDDITHPVLYTFAAANLIVDLAKWVWEEHTITYLRADEEELQTGITSAAFYTFAESELMVRLLHEKKRR